MMAPDSEVPEDRAASVAAEARSETETLETPASSSGLFLTQPSGVGSEVSAEEQAVASAAEQAVSPNEEDAEELAEAQERAQEEKVSQAFYASALEQVGKDHPNWPEATARFKALTIAGHATKTFIYSLRKSRGLDEGTVDEVSNRLNLPIPRKGIDKDPLSKRHLLATMSLDAAIEAYCGRLAAAEGITVEEARKKALAPPNHVCESGGVKFWNGEAILCKEHKLSNCGKCVVDMGQVTINDIAKQLSGEHIEALLNALHDDGRPVLPIIIERDGEDYVDEIDLKVNPKRAPNFGFDVRCGAWFNFNDQLMHLPWLGEMAIYKPETDRLARGVGTVLIEQYQSNPPDLGPLTPDSFPWSTCDECEGLTWLVGPPENCATGLHPSHYAMYDRMEGCQQSIIVSIDGAYCPKGGKLPAGAATASDSAAGSSAAIATEERATWAIFFGKESMYNALGTFSRDTLVPRKFGEHCTYNEDPADLPYAARVMPVTAHTAVFAAALQALRTINDWIVPPHDLAIEAAAKTASPHASRRAATIRVVMVTTSTEFMDALCQRVPEEWVRVVRDVTPKMWEDLEKGTAKKKKRHSKKKKGAAGKDEDDDEGNDEEGVTAAEKNDSKEKVVAKEKGKEKATTTEKVAATEKIAPEEDEKTIPKDDEGTTAGMSKTAKKKAKKLAAAKATAAAGASAAVADTSVTTPTPAADQAPVAGPSEPQATKAPPADKGKGKETAAATAEPAKKNGAKTEPDWDKIEAHVAKVGRKWSAEERLLRCELKAGEWAGLGDDTRIRNMNKEVVYVDKKHLTGVNINTISGKSDLPVVPNSAILNAIVREIGNLACNRSVLVSYWLVPPRFVKEATEMAREALAGREFKADAAKWWEAEKAKRAAADGKKKAAEEEADEA